MTLTRQVQPAKLRVRSMVSIAGVLAVATVACLELTGSFQYAFDPSSLGGFGFSVNSRWIVDDVASGSTADKAGIKVGDSIGRDMPLRGREIVGGSFSPRAGERLEIDLNRNGKRHSLTLVASPGQLSRADGVSSAILTVSVLVFFLIGLIVVLVRPSKMTWGFYLFAVISTFLGPGDPHIVSPALTLAYMLASIGLAMPAGLFGCVVFCLRFPSDSVTGWRQTAENLAVAPFVVLVFGQSLSLLAKMSFIASPTFVDAWWPVWVTSILLCLAVSVISLARTYRSSVGLERQRIKWVFFGLVIASAAPVAFVLQALHWIEISELTYSIVASFIVALPIAVAYAVIRYRVIDVRFMVSRTLVLGIIVTIVVALIALLDHAFSAAFANSPSKTAIYGGLALVMGFLLNVVRQRVTTFVDLCFFRQWHDAQALACAVGDAIRRSTVTSDLYGPLTAGLGSALSLSSTALFEPLGNGGFVRVAAYGWAPRMLWHLLPGSVAALQANSRRTTVIPSREWSEQNVPMGIAQPSLMVPIIAGKDVRAVLLCGAHENGTSLDPDELRRIRWLCADAAQVYAQAPSLGLDRPDSIELRGLPAHTVTQ